ncbi:homeodomain-only protein isoform 1-T2 [Discoglossus pictus]
MSSHQKETHRAEDPNLTEEQLEILENNFNTVCKQPDETTMMLIAAEAGLSEEDTCGSAFTQKNVGWHSGEVTKWFRERLAKWKKSEGLPVNCGSVMD